MDDVKYNFRAFTLMETVVAFVIIMISFSIAGVTFLSSESSSKFWIKMKVESEMDDLLIKTKMNNSFLDETYEYAGYFIEKEINQINEEKGLIEVRLTAFTDNNVEMVEKNFRIKIDGE